MTKFLVERRNLATDSKKLRASNLEIEASYYRVTDGLVHFVLQPGPGLPEQQVLAVPLCDILTIRRAN
jgi:hypothetical protein